MSNPDESMERWTQYRERGWCPFPIDPELLDWIAATRPAIDQAITAPENADWWRYGDTWFAGVNALPNGADGAVPFGMPITGRAIDFIRSTLETGPFTWDRAQISVCKPGYPRPMAGESDAVFRFRRDRDAAHVDGLLREKPGRRRFLREYHAFILGIPITCYDEGAAPFTIWEGSHRFIGEWLRQSFDGHPPESWADQDITESYQTIRRTVLETCPRRIITAEPGACYLVHPHALHGMSAWQDGAKADPAGRIILYFRPAQADLSRWLVID